jgi:2'-5' RNA ligase
MFVALVLPDEVIEHLADVVSSQQETGTDFRWTAPEQWHVTLAFMADVRVRNLDDLAARPERGVGRRTAFDVALGGGGAFPRPSRARVLYTGVDGRRPRSCVGSRSVPGPPRPRWEPRWTDARSTSMSPSLGSERLWT